jgi:hypothetical protein
VSKQIQHLQECFLLLVYYITFLTPSSTFSEFSGYFSGHGLKVQVVMLPNGMIGSIFVASLRHSDSGLLNMSGLNIYLTSLFRDFRENMLGPNQDIFPAVYGDGIFPALSCIVPRYVHNRGPAETAINVRMASLRQCIEHLFGLHKNLFVLFSTPRLLRLLDTGVETRKKVLVSFFILNCYQCLNESMNHFDLRPPSLEEYIPCNEVIPPAPEVTDDELGETYQFHRRG